MYLTIKLDTVIGEIIEIGGDKKFISGLDIDKVIEKIFKNVIEFTRFEGHEIKGGFTFKIDNRVLNVVYGLEDNICELLLIDGNVHFDDLDEERIDDLTDLYIKNKFIKDLGEILQEERTNLQIYLLDIDNFRRVNDKVGVDNGDIIIKELVDRILQNVISNFTLYRFEEDCFAIIREGKKEDKFINHIQDLFDEPFITGNADKIYLSLSIGYVDVDSENDVNPHSLVDKALIALYSSKDTGKGICTKYSSSINDRNYREMEIEGMIREALREKQFTLHYQPQFSMEKKSIVGAEALIRWFHPEAGFISPGEFIPIAEKTGLIVQIGEWVVEEACRQQREWLDDGLDLVKIGVNIGSLHFNKASFVKDITDALDRFDLPYEYLGLEITEGSVIDDADDMILKLEKLKNLGIHISIDDFGTGYSSLSYLKKFKIDTLKIDQSFVINMPDKNEDIAIVRAIIDLAKNLNIKVIAEGVESNQVKNLLMDMNCNDMQGYLFSKPISKEAFKKLLIDDKESPNIEMYDDNN